MARKKIKLEYIEDKKLRNTTLRKRTKGLTKKLTEYVTMLGVEGKLIIRLSEDDVCELNFGEECPSEELIKKVIKKLQDKPNPEHSSPTRWPTKKIGINVAKEANEELKSEPNQSEPNQPEPQDFTYLEESSSTTQDEKKIKTIHQRMESKGIIMNFNQGLLDWENNILSRNNNIYFSDNEMNSEMHSERHSEMDSEMESEILSATLFISDQNFIKSNNMICFIFFGNRTFV